MEELVELPNGILMEPVPAYEQDHPVMALAVNKQKNKAEKYEGLVREIVRREGNVAVPGFVDRSRLFVVESKDLLAWKRKGELKIKGIDSIVKRLIRPEMEFIGLEDPDIYFDGKTMHVYYAIAFAFKRNDENDSVACLGHAQGSSLQTLKATFPVLCSDLTRPESYSSFKEVAISPVTTNKTRINLCESGYSDAVKGYGISIIIAVRAESFSEKWKILKTVADPPKMNYAWCQGDLSPGQFFAPDFLKHKDLLVGIVNGRSAKHREGTKLIHGRFSVGLMLFDPKTGEIPWISPEPLISDPDAKTITFASDFVQTDKENGILFAHVDDSFVRAYRLNAKVLKEFLPKN
jgi:hypothetical protein